MVTLWFQLSHKISLGSHGGVNFVTKYIVFFLLVYLEGISNITAAEPGGGGDFGAMVGYFDDGAYSYAHSEPAVLSQVLTRKYNLLEEWISGNRLVINPEKTHLMVMGPKKRTQVSIQAGTSTIYPYETETLLGGHLHQSMQWNHHLRDGKKSLMKQLTSRTNGLKKIARNATFNTRLMVDNGVFMSKVMYLMKVWGDAQ